MKRGTLVRVAIPGDYGKPRPGLVIQADHFSGHASTTILPLTTELIDSPSFRVTVDPHIANGLRERSQVMVDKAHTLPARKLGEPIGSLADGDLATVDRALALFLGLA